MNSKESILAEEVRLWNTPLITAYLLWEFTLSFCESHPEGDAPVAILHFFASAMLTSPQLNKTISDRRKNLQSYALGFEENKRTDVLLSLQDRINNKKTHTMSAIDAAVSTGLLSWEIETGKLFPSKLTKQPARGKNIRASIKSEANRARILGRWFSEHDIPTIATYLRVDL